MDYEGFLPLGLTWVGPWLPAPSPPRCWLVSFLLSLPLLQLCGRRLLSFLYFELLSFLLLSFLRPLLGAPLTISSSTGIFDIHLPLLRFYQRRRRHRFIASFGQPTSVRADAASASIAATFCHSFETSAYSTIVFYYLLATVKWTAAIELLLLLILL